MLEASPAQRYRSVGEVASAIAACLQTAQACTSCADSSLVEPDVDLCATASLSIWRVRTSASRRRGCCRARRGLIPNSRRRSWRHAFTSARPALRSASATQRTILIAESALQRAARVPRRARVQPRPRASPTDRLGATPRRWRGQCAEVSVARTAIRRAPVRAVCTSQLISAPAKQLRPREDRRSTYGYGTRIEYHEATGAGDCNARVAPILRRCLGAVGTQIEPTK
jgi:hypothetical protein